MGGHCAGSPWACWAMDRKVSPAATVYSSVFVVGAPATGVAEARGEPLGLGLGGAAITNVGLAVWSAGNWEPKLLPRRTTPTPRAMPKTAASSRSSSEIQGHRLRRGAAPASWGGAA